MKVHQVYKKIGETPLEALEKFRKKSKISPAAKLTYAGRLDPMASGVLLILEGATQADREKYMGMDKEYKVQVLFGFETDSYDLLGMPVLPSRVHPTCPTKSASGGRSWRDPSLRRDGLKERLDELEKLLKIYQGTITLPVPPYSSVPYKGKPLFEWARAGKKVKLPLREMNVKKIKLEKLVSISAGKLISYIQKNIKKVRGDFRQEEILKAWSNILTIQSGAKNPLTKKYLISNILISCSSGTYIRSIAHDLGKKLETSGVVFSLERTKVGKFKKSL